MIDKKSFPKGVEVLAILCALTGVFLLATHGNINELIISKKALIIGLLSSLAVVVYNVQPKRLLKQFNSSMLLGWAMFMGGTVLTMLVKPWKYEVNLNLTIVLVVSIIIIFGTILAFSFYMIGVKLIGPAKASLYACIEPVIAALLSALWLSVSFTWIDIVGFLFIISTIFIITIPSLNNSTNIQKNVKEILE